MILMAEPTEKQKIGRLGEDIAVKYLENKGFLVIERNYLKKCGEIDVIAKKAGITHFIEVKSVTRENLGRNVSRYICLRSMQMGNQNGFLTQLPCKLILKLDGQA
ncbi:MAG: hypothetical protein UW27_C0008G0048 [Parcubacteria group bacterium GW2011_GWA1_44_13]|nr:MAG: hypothetical protein UW27_C0008G0048 [Parcubacteria group bacterium GW2011_GWA1_44_13]